MPAAHRGPYSVGSGDAFTAGLLAAMARGATLPDALCLAGAAGAASARLPGQGELDPADVERTRLDVRGDAARSGLTDRP